MPTGVCPGLGKPSPQFPSAETGIEPESKAGGSEPQAITGAETVCPDGRRRKCAAVCPAKKETANRVGTSRGEMMRLKRDGTKCMGK